MLEPTSPIEHSANYVTTAIESTLLVQKLRYKIQRAMKHSYSGQRVRIMTR